VAYTKKDGFLLASEFVCAARRYWFAIFPRVGVEIRRLRTLAARVPDPLLRDVAQSALAQKALNLEGAAAFATLAAADERPRVVRTLVACQALCDYLDLLCEQPCEDPVANGHALHEALSAAIASGDASGDYYRHCSHVGDGGYLRSLVQCVHDGIASLPSRHMVAEPLACAAGRVAAYQTLNHLDAESSHEPFRSWASVESRSYANLCWWEAGAAAGSPLSLHVLVGVGSQHDLRAEEVQAVDDAYFPWVDALHSLLDSLVDRGEDLAMGAPRLIDCYPTPEAAATRIWLIAREALARTWALPRGRRHALLVAAMTCFYLCDLRRSSSPHVQLIARSLLAEIGWVAAPSMSMLRTRRLLRRDDQREHAAADSWLASASHRPDWLDDGAFTIQQTAGLGSRKSST
jgi:tetraprenyl-beta-curcumene synthase